MPTKPQFQHDCPKCEYLGSTPDADFYVCRTVRLIPDPGTLLVRYSDEGADYTSFPVGYVPNYGPNPDYPETAKWHAARMALANAMLVYKDTRVTP